MEFVYTGLVSVAVAMLTFLLQTQIKENCKLKQEKELNAQKKEKALEKGVRCLLRSELTRQYNDITNKGSVTLREYGDWTDMYEAYEGLGGNGPVKHMRETLEDFKMKSGR